VTATLDCERLAGLECERPEWQQAMCVGEIKAFARGGLVGLDKLSRVLPNVFKAYPKCSPAEALSEAGLEPVCIDGQLPTFFFRPLLEGPRMIHAGVWDDQHARNVYRSQELMGAYEALRSEWSPAPISSNS
jgi:hypothetical protein